MTTKTYRLHAFTADLDRIVTRYAENHAALVAKVEPLFCTLLSDMSWLDEKYARGVRDRSIQYLLYRDPNGRYIIVSVVFWQGYATPVHDHLTWGLVGVWHGEEEEERYKRADESLPARLRHVGTVVNGPGAVSRLVPPDQEIHRIRAVSPFPSCSIHLYGADINGMPRHQYNLETGEITEFCTTYVVV